jgi:hypothetical protein
MEEKLFVKLLLEHKNDLAEIRSIALKFIKYASEHIKNENVLEIELTKAINKEKFVELFIKMSSLVMKIIPLEQQVYGNNLVSKNDLKRLKNKHKKELDISAEDLLLIKDFLKNFENK